MWDTGNISEQTQHRNPYASLNTDQLQSEIRRTEDKLRLLKFTLDQKESDHVWNPL